MPDSRIVVQFPCPKLGGIIVQRRVGSNPRRIRIYNIKLSEGIKLTTVTRTNDRRTEMSPIRTTGKTHLIAYALIRISLKLIARLITSNKQTLETLTI